MSIDAPSEVFTDPKKISRRGFIKLAGASVAGYALYKYDQVLSGLFGTEYEKSTEQAKKYIKERYGLDILVGLPVNAELANITGDIPNAYELSRGLTLIIEELIKYPPDLLKDGGVKAVRFLSNAKLNGKSIGGFVSEFFEGVSTLCYTGGPFETLREYFRGAFHHELFHLLDWNDGGYGPDNEQWRSIHNCGGCQAYRDIKGIDNIDKAAPKLSEQGFFISEYGQRNPVEDRAEFAQTLMMPRTHRDLLIRDEKIENERTRQILKEKYELTKQYYLKWSNGSMNENYWRDLIDGNVQENYFSSRSKSE